MPTVLDVGDRHQPAPERGDAVLAKSSPHAERWFLIGFGRLRHPSSIHCIELLVSVEFGRFQLRPRSFEDSSFSLGDLQCLEGSKRLIVRVGYTFAVVKISWYKPVSPPACEIVLDWGRGDIFRRNPVALALVLALDNANIVHNAGRESCHSGMRVG